MNYFTDFGTEAICKGFVTQYCARRNEISFQR